MMEINQTDFADASLEKIVIEYNKIDILVELDNKQKLEILCEDIVGVDNLCLWDENFLESIKVGFVDTKNPLVNKIRQSYNVEVTYDNGKSLKTPIYDIQICFNGLGEIIGHIYCQKYKIKQVARFH